MLYGIKTSSVQEKVIDPYQCIESMGVIRRAFWAREKCSDIGHYAYTEDPDVVILNGPAAPVVGKFNCKTGAYLWRAPIKFVSTVAYHPRARRVLGYAKTENALIELDADTGEVVRELRKTEFGPIGYSPNVRYATPYECNSPFRIYGTQIDDDPDLIMLADGENHIAGMLNMKTGKYVWHFGEYGKPGDDLAHLNKPHDVVWTLPGGAWIADHKNHRFLNVCNVMTDPQVGSQWIFPRPTSVSFVYNTPSTSFFPAVAAISGGEFGYQPLTLVIAEFDEVCLETATCVLGWMAIGGNQTSFNPRDPGLVQVNQWNSTFEVDWMRASRECHHLARFAKPYIITHPLKAHESWSSEPVVGLINRKITAKIFATADCRAVIEVPTPALRLLGARADYRWVPIDEFHVKAGKMALHTQEAPLAVCRITVTADKADTELTVHVEGY